MITSSKSKNQDKISVKTTFYDPLKVKEGKSGRTYTTKHTKRKSRKEKKEKLSKSLDYKLQCIFYVIYCIWYATQHVAPSQTTLGACVGVNRDTCRSYLRKLVAMGKLPKWTFRWFDTCIYNLPHGKRSEIIAMFRHVKRPRGFIIPPWLYGIIAGHTTPEQLRSLLKYAITHESFLKKGIRDNKYEQSKKKTDSKLLKSKFGSPDPRLVKLLLEKYDKSDLNSQRAEFLARNNERVLSLAMEDLDSYVLKFGKKIKSHFGFLLNRCKHHGPVIFKEIVNDKAKVRKQIESDIQGLINAVNEVESIPVVKSLNDILKLESHLDKQGDYNFMAECKETAKALKACQKQYVNFFEKGGKWKNQKPPVLVKTPLILLKRIKSYLTSIKSKVAFIGAEKQLNRQSDQETTEPTVLFLINRASPEKSKLKIFQKVKGIWSDKEFTFDRPDLETAVKDYFRASFRTLRFC